MKTREKFIKQLTNSLEAERKTYGPQGDLKIPFDYVVASHKEIRYRVSKMTEEEENSFLRMIHHVDPSKYNFTCDQIIEKKNARLIKAETLKEFNK
jgi:hypothetical protein